MKKFISILACGLFILLGSQAMAQNANSNEGRAVAAFRQSCNYTGAVETTESVVGICFVSGFITEVLITPKLNCQQIDCNAVRIAPLARVTFGCDNEVMSVECLR